ncbi:MAG: thiamine-phosphate kinase [Verrucomicrobia bacterium]|nr:thiamine-phosphate kinase [Verrucomicrobiota bacterium]
MHPFAPGPRDRVDALGERGLIASIGRWLGTACPAAPAGIGDDCAVLPPARHRQLLTVDPVIFGRHFDAAVQPAAVGAKLLKRNLSDIAAMGGRPRAAVVSLCLDRATRVSWLREFHRGLATAARRHGVAIVGGDVAEVPGALIASLTLLGEADGERVLIRQGARSGDWIAVTGRLGGSLASGHHLRFTPRLAEGRWLARRGEIRAMMDVSDGLAKDLSALTPRGTRAALDLTAIPRRRGCTLAAALGDGEDYELLCVIDARANLRALQNAWRRRFSNLPLTFIGRFLRNRGGQNAPVALPASGYEHLRPAP